MITTLASLMKDCPRIYRVELNQTLSCGKCQKMFLEEDVFKLDNRNFCSYRCAFRFIYMYLKEYTDHQLFISGRAINSFDEIPYGKMWLFLLTCEFMWRLKDAK